MTSSPVARLARLVHESGPIRFDAYVEHCLYDPGWGFYTRGGGASGRRGDFLTSPEVGPLFGAVLARVLDAWWEAAGRPRPFVVIDAGAGPGTLIRSLLVAGPACSDALELVAVERSPQLRQRHADLLGRGVTSTGELPDVRGAVVIANELLDNLAFRVLERSGGGWSELAVDAAEDGAGLRYAFLPVDGPDADRADEVAADVPIGSRIPWVESARRWTADVLAGEPAHLLVFDYGARTTAELARRPWTGWVRTYREHQRAGSPLDGPGTADVTVEVPVDQLPAGATWTTQAEFLTQWGIDDLVEEGRRQWAEGAARPDLAALRGRSRVREAEALLDADGLGSWLVGHWSTTGRAPAPPGRGSVPR